MMVSANTAFRIENLLLVLLPLGMLHAAHLQMKVATSNMPPLVNYVDPKYHIFLAGTCVHLLQTNYFI